MNCGGEEIRSILSVSPAPVGMEVVAVNLEGSAPDMVRRPVVALAAIRGTCSACGKVSLEDCIVPATIDGTFISLTEPLCLVGYAVPGDRTCDSDWYDAAKAIFDAHKARMADGKDKA